MNLHTGFIAGMVFSVGMLGVMEPLLAAKGDSQNLRGLGGRVFMVTAELTEDRLGIGLPIGTTLLNCYIFSSEPDPDGNTWFESAIPDTKGTWSQDSNGARTSFAVTAFSITGDTIRQWGQVTPARGKGTLQLVVDTHVDIIPGDQAELEFYSVGEEINAAQAALYCPDELYFTFPE